MFEQCWGFDPAHHCISNNTEMPRFYRLKIYASSYLVLFEVLSVGVNIFLGGVGGYFVGFVCGMGILQTN